MAILRRLIGKDDVARGRDEWSAMESQVIERLRNDREHVAAAISLSFSRETWSVTVSALKIGEISGSF